MAKNKPTIGREENISAEAYVARLKEKGFLPHLDKDSMAKRKQAFSDKLINVDVSAFTPTNGGEPFKVPFPNFGQSNFSNNVCSNEENEVNEESTLSFKR